MSITEKIRFRRQMITEPAERSAEVTGNRPAPDTSEGNVIHLPVSTYRNPFEGHPLLENLRENAVLGRPEQIRLLDEVRDLGIISMLEEVTGDKVENFKRNKQGGHAGEGMENSGSWKAVILEPRGFEYASPSIPLKIYLERFWGSRELRHLSRVSISYDSEKKLDIRGDKPFFNSTVDSGNIDDVRGVIEDSLVDAILNPKIYQRVVRWEERS